MRLRLPPRDPFCSRSTGEATQRIFHARLVIPVEPGPVTLYYPKWIPGNHGPTGPIADLAGLKMQAGGKDVSWRRDDVDMYAFHCTVPGGSPRAGGATRSSRPRSGAVSPTRLKILPSFAGTRSCSTRRGSRSTPSIPGVAQDPGRLEAEHGPADRIASGTATDGAGAEDRPTRFGPVTLSRLVDSPVIAGRYHREIRLGTGEPAIISTLSPTARPALEITPKQKAAYEKLVAEAGALFGSRHYKSYRFLVTLSDKMPSHGLEHHESSDDGMPEHSMSDDEAGKAIAYLLPHEYVHSWNGKYRRPPGWSGRPIRNTNNTRCSGSTRD